MKVGLALPQAFSGRVEIIRYEAKPFPLSGLLESLFYKAPTLSSDGAYKDDTIQLITHAFTGTEVEIRKSPNIPCSLPLELLDSPVSDAIVRIIASGRMLNGVVRLDRARLCPGGLVAPAQSDEIMNTISTHSQHVSVSATCWE